MADLLQAVKVDETRSLIVLSNLEDVANGIGKARDTFRVSGPARSTPSSPAFSRRYGGSIQTGDQAENGTLTAGWLVQGTTHDQAISRLEAMLAATDYPHQPGSTFIRWQPEGASRPGLYGLRGAPTYAPAYSIAAFRGAKLFRTEVTWPVAPLVEELCMTWWDDFRIRTGTSSPADRLLDVAYNGWTAGSGGLGTPSAGAWSLPVNPAGGTDSAIIYNAARRRFTDGMITKLFRPDASPGSSQIASVGLKYDPADGKMVMATISGTTLAVQTWDNGTLTSRATATITTPLVSGSVYALRLQANGDTITASYWSVGVVPAVFNPASFTPSHQASVNLSAQGYGATRSGYPALNGAYKIGIATTQTRVWIDANYYDFTAGAPTEKAIDVPGSAPAKVDLEFQFHANEGGAGLYPRFALVGWRPNRTAESVAGTITGIATTGILDPASPASESQGQFSTAWSTLSVTGTQNTDARVITAGTLSPSDWSQPASISLRVNPTIFTPDDFDDICWVQVWIRAAFGASASGGPPATPAADTSANPWRVRVRSASEVLGSSAPARYSREFGADGMWVPTNASAHLFRLYPVGTVPIEPNSRTVQTITLDVLYGTGIAVPTARFMLDRMFLVPANSQFHSPVGKQLDANYPQFVLAGTNRRLVRHDLVSSLAGTAMDQQHAAVAAGLNGSPIEPQPGSTIFHLNFTDKPPMDPAATTGSDVITRQTGVRFMITPRHRIAATA